jgi:hypothetical protein
MPDYRADLAAKNDGTRKPAALMPGWYFVCPHCVMINEIALTDSFEFKLTCEYCGGLVQLVW